MSRDSMLSGPWPGGINSLVDPAFISDQEVQWSTNTINRGGNYQTRPGYTHLPDFSATIPPVISPDRYLEPRGMTIFKPKDQSPYLVVALGTKIKISAYPFQTWSVLAGINLDPGNSPVTFERAIKGASTADDGTETILASSYPVLMIQTGGNTRAAFWDGTTARHLDPTKTPALSETPPGLWMKWVNSRLWVSNGSKIRVSNALDPLKFTEEDISAQGGAFFLPDVCTGMAVTPDFQALLAFTNKTTTSFQVGILDRTLWEQTNGFQSLLLPGIGCIAGKTCLNQYGLTWWLSEGGFIGLDAALQTYRSSKIQFKDNNMARSKGNLSPDMSGACAGTFENFIVLSVPSGDTYNAHTWVMDQGVVEELNSEAPPAWSSCWTGTRPVEWVTDNINGQSRCFHLSRDYPIAGDTKEWISGVWEAFCPSKVDFGLILIPSPALIVKFPACTLETKLMTKDGGQKTFHHFKITARDFERVVSMTGLYASTNSGYKQVLDKIVVATTDSLNTNQTASDLSTIPSYIKQTRVIRSAKDEAQVSDNDLGVESLYTRNKDIGFSVLLIWAGQMSLQNITLYYTTRDEIPDGKIEELESTVRAVEPDGTNIITTDPPIASTFTNLTSGNIEVISPRFSEIFYSSNQY